MSDGQQNGARDFARDATRAGEIGWRVGAARPSVTEGYRAGYRCPDADRKHERRSARETPMQIGNAATPGRQPVVLNASPEQRPSSANDLRDGALKIAAANPVDPLKRADKPVAGGRDVGGCDADDGTAGHHEHHGEIAERRNSTACDLLDASMGAAVARRDRKTRSNLLVHGRYLARGLRSRMYMQALCA
jgi:hypothetical protein